MEDQNYTIKDIAQMAGVSAGTVDRVLHNRGDVSQKSKEKVQKVLDEINYQPNVFAIGLAAKKKYTITCMIPYYMEHDYWHSVATGIERARQELRPFNVSVDYLHYKHGDRKSYQDACQKIEKSNTDALLLAPNFREDTLSMLAYLKDKNIPFAFIDFDIEEAKALKYIGQDSYKSGYIAAKILMRNYQQGQELILFLNNNKDNPAEIQMKRRLEGFMKYISEEHKDIAIHEVILNKNNPEKNNEILSDFFRKHPKATLGAVFNSRVYQVGHYLREKGQNMTGLIGYDLLRNNTELLKSGEVTYLIGQRPGLQGYCGVKTLCDNIVFKKSVEPLKYMPIDILIKENIDFYFEFE
ncbi:MULTISPECIES: LacI family DNA-binding transcriptional regulator [Bacteroides]|jgi:transcriptional regulator|uniref:LacI family DNA-binding transcriptional regulator n=1 Tax=Bacteroides TaxID=816 RepID=UPI001899F7AC|nr:substrate-binding domain-containing protein [Bacteroides nordii]MCE8464715.1 substrate-binding domain-containing protein [Bacteroides nordii]MCG4770246.1 substrate-binding domain-containing protein [Bacteroides nordii]MCQ4913234.1 substrate-binding domain-containing protein [Bacteroides nordii]UYU49966.1 substrate-binding domain-containing protein [Bacteroides nordii]